MINTRRLTRGRAWVAVLAPTLAAIVWSTNIAAEARVLDRQRYSGTSEIDEMNCGRHQHIEETLPRRNHAQSVAGRSTGQAVRQLRHP